MFVRNPLVPMTVVGIVAIVLIWATALRPVHPPIGAAFGTATTVERSALRNASLAAARGR